VPWCEECSELVEDEDLDEDGGCPRCGTPLVEEERRPIPWYFKAMIVASIVYLGYRTYQGVTWVIHHV
jgi:uncharacterized paraquat-inducible protein A